MFYFRPHRVVLACEGCGGISGRVWSVVVGISVPGCVCVGDVFGLGGGFWPGTYVVEGMGYSFVDKEAVSSSFSVSYAQCAVEVVCCVSVSFEAVCYAVVRVFVGFLDRKDVDVSGVHEVAYSCEFGVAVLA